MGARLKRAANFAGKYAPDLRDLLVFGGIGCAAYGAAQIYPPAAWIIAGAAIFWLGVRR
jgi:hypothetical protein